MPADVGAADRDAGAVGRWATIRHQRITTGPFGDQGGTEHDPELRTMVPARAFGGAGPPP
jgi:hypothetical protein